MLRQFTQSKKTQLNNRNYLKLYPKLINRNPRKFALIPFSLRAGKIERSTS
jgi:hypothetical protein